MDQHGKVSRKYKNKICSEEEMDLRRGPWTVEEDFALINYISHHGEGHWNALARCAGLKRTGKSCRLRWLNYLRPDLRRGNMTLEEQLLILELHSRWGNRWSKIAQYLPGRTDNEIKNYWRTRVQKHAKQLKCDVNSKQFKDTMRYLWMPRLVERIQATTNNYDLDTKSMITNFETDSAQIVPQQLNTSAGVTTYSLENSSAASSDSLLMTPVNDVTGCFSDNYVINQGDYYYPTNDQLLDGDQSLNSSSTDYFNQGIDFIEQNSHWIDGGDASGNLWSIDDMWFIQQ